MVSAIADIEERCILSDDAGDGYAPQQEGRASMPRNQLFSSTTMSQMEHEDSGNKDDFDEKLD